MARTSSGKISHFLSPFLKARIEEWIAAQPGRTARELAARSGVTEQQVGQIKNGLGRAGYGAASGLYKVFGYDTPEQMIEEARIKWIASGRQPVGPPAEHHPRLHDRREWETVARAARAERPEIVDPGAFEDVGFIYESDQFPRPLTSQVVGNLAYVFYVERCRRRSEEPKSGPRGR